MIAPGGRAAIVPVRHRTESTTLASCSWQCSRLPQRLSNHECSSQGHFITSGLAPGEDEVNRAVGAASVGAEGGGDVEDMAASEQRDGEVPTDGEGFRCGAGADLAAVFVERDIANVVELVLDAPMASGDGEQGGGVGLIGRQAGDGTSDFRLDFAGGLPDTLALNPAELLDVWPRLADRPGVAHPDVLGRIGERPEDAPFKAPVVGFGRGVHRDGERGAPLLPRLLLPDWQDRWYGRIRDEGEQRGKKRRGCRLPGRADCL